MSDNSFKDKSGRNVQAGDLIVYAAKEDTAYLRFAKVLNIDDEFRIRSVSRGYGDYALVIYELCKPSTLVVRVESRVLILERHQIPEDVLALLDTVEVPATVSEPAGLTSAPKVIGKVKSHTITGNGVSITWERE